MAKGLGMECTRSSSRSQSSRNPAAQARLRGSPGEPVRGGAPSVQAPSLAGFCGCSPSARMILWVLTLFAIALCSQISLYCIEMELPTSTQELITGILSLKGEEGHSRTSAGLYF